VSLFGEGYYDFLDREQVRLHLGARFDNISRLNIALEDMNKTYRLVSAEGALILTPDRNNAIKIIGHIAQNFGIADIYSPNQYFTDERNSIIPYDHFEDPTLLPDKSTEVISKFEYIPIKPEISQSVELVTFHEENDLFGVDRISFALKLQTDF
jgi:hypothetical protein